MEKKKKIPGILICLLLLAVVLAIYYCTVYTGLSQKTALLEAQHTQNAQQLSDYQIQIAQKAQIQKATADFQTKIKKSSQSFGIPASGLGEDLQKGFASAGVTPLNVTMSAASEGKKTSSGRILTQVPITITADCTPDELTALLHYFERGTDAVYVVNSVSATSKDTQGGGKDYAVSLSLTGYYLAGTGSGS